MNGIERGYVDLSEWVVVCLLATQELRICFFAGRKRNFDVITVRIIGMDLPDFATRDDPGFIVRAEFLQLFQGSIDVVRLERECSSCAFLAFA